MDITQDARYAQIQSETTSETQSQQSLRAFSGFGRSTQLLSEVDTVQAENQKRIKQLSSVISMEEQLKQMQEHGDTIDSNFYKALAAAQSQLDTMNSDAAKRRLELSQKLMGVGTQEETKHQVGLKFRNPFRARKSKKLQIKPFTYTQAKIKPIESLSGISQSIGKITKIGTHIVKPLSLLKASWLT